MDATVTLPAHPWPAPRPVVLFLGSGRLATSLCQALGCESFHTLQAQSWSEVRSLSGFLRPDLIVLAGERPEEQAWLGCFAAEVPCLDVATPIAPGPVGRPLRWSEFLEQVRALVAPERQAVPV